MSGRASGLSPVGSPGERRLRLVVGLYGAQTLVAGIMRVLVVVTALRILDLPGCGSGKDVATPETVQSEGLDQLWDVYQLAAKQKKQPPKQASDLNAFRLGVDLIFRY